MAFKLDDLIAKVKAQIPPNLLSKFAPKKEASGDQQSEGTKTGTRGAKTLTDTDTEAHEKTQTKSHVTASKVDGKPAVDPKAAKKSKIIKIVVGIAIVFFAADEFLNTEKPAETETAPVVTKKKKEKIPPVETPAPEQVQATPEPTPTAAPVVEVATPAPTPEIVPTEAPVVAVTEVPVVPTVPDVVPTANPADRTPSGESEVKSDMANSDVTSFQVGETVPEDKVKDATVNEGTIDKVVEQLDKQKALEYVSPPTYEELGRGLVYNCKGLHWACINKDAYFVCRDNMKWNATHTKPKECVTINVYATNEDCEQIQLHNINTREKTEFCN